MQKLKLKNKFRFKVRDLTEFPIINNQFSINFSMVQISKKMIRKKEQQNSHSQKKTQKIIERMPRAYHVIFQKIITSLG